MKKESTVAKKTVRKPVAKSKKIISESNKMQEKLEQLSQELNAQKESREAVLQKLNLKERIKKFFSRY